MGDATTDSTNNDWGFEDPNNEWGFTAPDPVSGPRIYRPEMVERDLFVGKLLERREYHANGKEMVILYYEPGWREYWWWRYCPKYRYRDGVTVYNESTGVNGEWYSQWDNDPDDGMLE